MYIRHLSVFLRWISTIYVEQLLKEIKVNKSSGYDHITPRLLKESASVICFPLCSIFNASIAQSKYPKNWKKVKSHLYLKRTMNSVKQPIDQYLFCRLSTPYLRSYLPPSCKLISRESSLVTYRLILYYGLS